MFSVEGSLTVEEINIRFIIMTTKKKAFEALRNPKLTGSILLGSAILSLLLTTADPTPIRRALGLEPNPSPNNLSDHSKPIEYQTNDVIASAANQNEGPSASEMASPKTSAIARNGE
jgi:hypothetical protein